MFSISVCKQGRKKLQMVTADRKMYAWKQTLNVSSCDLCFIIYMRLRRKKCASYICIVLIMALS